MWLWPVNEVIELVSGMPAPQFGDESSRMRFQHVCFILIYGAFFRVPRGVRALQAEDYWVGYKSVPNVEPAQLSRYSDWLQVGRQRGPSSNPGRVKNFLFCISYRSTMGPAQPPIELTTHLQIAVKEMRIYITTRHNSPRHRSHLTEYRATLPLRQLYELFNVEWNDGYLCRVGVLPEDVHHVPWYVSNFTLHNDLQIPFITE
jgi:hypothetical protein